MILSAFSYVKSSVRSAQIDNNVLAHTLRECLIVLNHNTVSELVFQSQRCIDSGDREGCFSVRKLFVVVRIQIARHYYDRDDIPDIVDESNVC